MKNKLMAAVEEANYRKGIPDFAIGDQVEVHQRILEGQKERIQVFSGVVIAKRGDGTRETFTVRRIVQGEGVRRAKLYYLRKRVGKATRLRERRAKLGDSANGEVTKGAPTEAAQK